MHLQATDELFEVYSCIRCSFSQKGMFYFDNMIIQLERLEVRGIGRSRVTDNAEKVVGPEVYVLNLSQSRRLLT